jgi:hypothetical protein
MYYFVDYTDRRHFRATTPAIDNPTLIVSKTPSPSVVLRQIARLRGQIDRWALQRCP